jgi:hypothetical protein
VRAVFKKASGHGPKARRFGGQCGVELEASLKEALRIIGHGSDLDTGFENGFAAAVSAAEEMLHRSGIIHFYLGTDEPPPIGKARGGTRQLEVVHVDHKKKTQRTVDIA